MNIKTTRTRFLAATMLAAMLTAGTASTFAVSNTFTLTASDASTLSSFTTWNVSGGGSSAPAAGTGGDTNDYFTGAFVLRTPTPGGDYTFGGDSLTVDTGGQFAIKGAVSSTVTVNNLILNGGQINVASGTSSGSPVFNLAGAITVNANGGLLRAFSNGSGGSNSKQVLNISAVIGGSGPLTIDFNGGVSNSRGTVRLSAANTYTGELKVLNNPYTTALQLNNFDALKFATLTVENTGGTGVGFNAGAGTYNVGALQGAVGTGTISTASGIILSVGAKNTTTSFAGVISGAGSLVKVGTGTLTLSGAHTFGGNLTVTDGTLSLANTGSLLFTLGNAGVTNKVTGAGTANFDGTFKLNLSGVTDTSGSWNLVDVGTLTESFTGTFLVADNTGSVTFTNNSGVWTSSNNLWTFNQSTGLLTLTSAVPEPSTYAALAGLATLAFVAGRRRRS